MYIRRWDAADGAAHRRHGFYVIYQLVLISLIYVRVPTYLCHHSAVDTESRRLSLLTLDQVAVGYREVVCITVVFIMAPTLGVALIARSLGLKVGIRAE